MFEMCFGEGNMKLQIFILILFFSDDLRSMEAVQSMRPLEIRAGYSARQGFRPAMEDAHVLLPDFDKNSALFAVYDGHGGAQVANFASQNLHLYIKESLLANPNESRKTILLDAFAKTEQRIIDERFTSGSTAVVAFIENRSLYCAWVGDSRAILIRNGKVIMATQDHKPDMPQERERIEQAGGKIYKIGGWRFGEKGLAVSRALGDQKVKEEKGGSGIIATPEILECNVQHDDLLLLACDGLWDTMSNEKAAESVTNLLTKKISDIPNDDPSIFQRRDIKSEGGDEHLLLISRALRNRALQSGDNISVILVSLKEKITP